MLKKIKSVFWKIFILLHSKRLKSPTVSEQEQINQLRKSFLSLPDADEVVPSEAGRFWNKNLNRLKRIALSEDPRKFLRWDVVRETMFVGNADFINTELIYLKSNKAWLTRWKSAIHESVHGSPAPYYKYIKSSGNLIHHAYHLAKFEEVTGIKIEQFDSILEFGGGYGSMCRLVHRLGFRGRYVIFDLPHFSILQKYYLSEIGLKINSTNLNSDSTGVFCVSELNDLRRIGVGGAASLFLATWSYSETPVNVRKSVLPELGLCQSHLIAYQDVFGEIDNVKYFSEEQEFRSCRKVLNESIPHLPGSRYLFGWGGKN